MPTRGITQNHRATECHRTIVLNWLHVTNGFDKMLRKSLEGDHMDLVKVHTIGRGGFGVVDKVRDGDGAEYARKTFSPASHIPVEVHDRLRKRFVREVMIQEQLGGKEIIPVLHSELDGDNPWFLMPLAEKTYERHIEDNLTAGSVDINAIADILGGIVSLHRLDYVHRDLNPKNILLHEGHWKLSDFGAALPPSGQTVTLTENTVIYTEQYCSPEQRKDFHNARPSADIYALGCILHDIFGTPPRDPYQKQTAQGPMGLIIEKCTELNPDRRPSIDIVQPMILDELIELGGQCRVVDAQSEQWLEKLEEIDSWDDATYADFARFFSGLDTSERADGHENDWVYSLSTPFMTRVSAAALSRIVARRDGVADAVIEKYCEWARSTKFLFAFSDSVCSRLTAIFDEGTPSHSASAMVALLELGASHNRWFAMRAALTRCAEDATDDDLAKRLAIEIRVEQSQDSLRRCIAELSWDKGKLANDIRRLLE